jgi:hypothetical protein
VYFIRKRTFYAQSESDVSYWLWALVAGLALLFVGYAYEALQEWRDRRRYPPPGQFVDVAGRRMHVFVQGDAGTHERTVVNVSRLVERMAAKYGPTSDGN